MRLCQKSILMPQYGFLAPSCECVNTDSVQWKVLPSAKDNCQDTKYEGNKITVNITNKSQEVSPFPSDDHKAAINSRDSMTNTSHK